MEPAQNQPLFQLNLDAQNGYTLRSAASWSKVLGVVSVIMGILLIIMGILAQNALNSSSGRRLYGMRSEDRSMAANIGMVFYMIMGVVFIISAIFSLNFGNRIGAAMRTNDQNALNAGFAGARNFFAFWTILLIICLLLVLISVATIASGGGR